MSVDSIFIAPEAGLPMQELEEAEVKAGRGIVGDRYFVRKGTYSVFRDSNTQLGRREPGRQITLVAAEGVEEALKAASIPALRSLGDFRRNIVLRGIPTSELQGAVGRTIALGQECVVFVHRSCVPCMYNERKVERAGLMEALWDCCGVSCEVVEGGLLRRGDRVVVGDMVDAERVDAGLAERQAGFLVRPSQRTLAMSRGLRDARSAVLSRLLKVDPGGVVRGIESYHTVGLQLFPKPKRFRRGEAVQARFGLMVAIFVGLLAVLTGSMRLQAWYTEWTAKQPMVTRPVWTPQWLLNLL